MATPVQAKAVTARQVAVWCATAVVVFAIAAGLWMAHGVVLLVFAAWLFGVAFEHAAGWVRARLKVRYGAALAVTLGVLLVVVAGMLAAAAGTIAAQWPQLNQSLRQAASTAPAPVRAVLQPVFGAGAPPGPTASGQNPSGGAGGQATGQDGGGVLRRALGWLGTAAGAVGSAVFVLVLAIYFAVDPQTYRKGLLRITPRSHRRRMRDALRRTDETLRAWLLGRLAAMAVVAVLTTAGLAALGVPLALTLGLIAGVLDFVPNVGPIAAAVPALLLAYQEGMRTVAWVAGLYLAIQMLEGYLLTPLIEKRAVEHPPGLVLMAQAGLGMVLGLPGLVLATPLVAAAIVLSETLSGHGADDAADSHEAGSAARVRG